MTFLRYNENNVNMLFWRCVYTGWGVQFSVLPMELVISVRQGGFNSDFTVVGFLVPEFVDRLLG